MIRHSSGSAGRKQVKYRNLHNEDNAKWVCIATDWYLFQSTIPQFSSDSRT